MSQGKTEIIQNLEDAGCDEEIVKAFMGCRKQGKEEECFQILKAKRKSLLDEVHNAEKKIDYLDYLVYQLKQKMI